MSVTPQELAANPKAALAKCYACTLYRQPFVATYGPAKAPLVIVGEGPGREEVRMGRPFFPREDPPNAGWLLDESLRQLGVDREKEVAYTNVVLCWPEGNRDPSNDEVNACRDRLLFEIRERHPRVILALGNYAARTVLKTKLGVAALRTMDHTLFDARVIPTYHPAALFRMGALFPDYAADLERAIKLLRGDLTLKRPRVPYVVIDTKERLIKVLGIIEGEISLDLETDALAIQRGAILCTGIGWTGRDGITKSAVIAEEVVYDPVCQRILNVWFRDQYQIYHNAPFDAGHMWAKGYDNIKIDDDTMLMAYALDERRGSHGLEVLAKTYYDAPNWKQQFLDPYLKSAKTSYRNVPRSALFPYNAYDTYYTRILRDSLWNEMDETLRKLYRGLMLPAANSLMRMGSRGIMVDLDYAGVLHKDYDVRLENALDHCIAMTGDKNFNPSSPQQVKEALIKRGFDLRSTRKDILDELPDPLAKKVIEYRHIRKMISTYIEGFVEWVDDNSRVHPMYKQHDTRTGRLSAEDPPIQTVPRASTERNLFVAPPGRVLVYADYNMHEYRTVAYLSGDPWLKQVFKERRDLHTEMVKEYFKGINISSPDEFEEARAQAKMVNFGLLYGRGAWSLSVQLEIPEQEAQKMIDQYFERMPLVRRFMKKQETLALTSGMIETVFGRRRRFGLITRENAHEVIKQAFNYPVQSTASDIALTALIQMDKVLDPKVWFPVTILHDGILVETDEKHAKEVAAQVTEIMMQAPRDTLPNLDFEWRVDTKVGTRWGSLTK